MNALARNFLGLMFFCAFFISFRADADNITKSNAFYRLQQGINTLQSKFQDYPAKDQRLLEQLRQNINELDGRLDANSASQIFLRSLTEDARLLQNASKADDAEQASGLVGLVANDIAAKLDTSQSSLGLAASHWDGLLKIAISTERAGKPVTGLLIRLNMAGLPTQDPAFITMNELTSPAHDTVPPGTYIILVSDAAGTTFLKQYRTVKGTSGELVQITISLP